MDMRQCYNSGTSKLLKSVSRFSLLPDGAELPEPLRTSQLEAKGVLHFFTMIFLVRTKIIFSTG